MKALWLGKSLAGSLAYWRTQVDAAQDGSTWQDLEKLLRWFGLTPTTGRNIAYPYTTLVRYSSLPHKAPGYVNSTFLHWIERISATAYNDPLFTSIAGAGLEFASEAAFNAIELDPAHRVGVVERPADEGNEMAEKEIEIQPYTNLRLSPSAVATAKNIVGESAATWQRVKAEQQPAAEGFIWWKFKQPSAALYSLQHPLFVRGDRVRQVTAQTNTHRKYFQYQMPARDLIAQHGIDPSLVSDSQVWYRGANENDVQGFDSSPSGIRARAKWDIEAATILKQCAPQARWVGGGFAHGNPNYNDAEICKAMQEGYATAYNSGLIVFDAHNYTKPEAGYPPKDFKTIAPIWLKRNWEFLFTRCGFDPRVRAIIHTEAGHECGFGGMAQAGFTTEEYLDWCRWSMQVQSTPLSIGGVGYVSPVLCETQFQWGNTHSGSGGWWGYRLDPYIGAITDLVQARISPRDVAEAFEPVDVYAGTEPAYTEPPAKAF
jgi:hypothetical protein